MTTSKSRTVGSGSFEDAIEASDAVVVFHRVEKTSPSSKDGPAPSSAKGVIGLSALLQKCGTSENSECYGVTMADIKSVMVDIGIGRATNQIDFWISASRKLLDDSLTFPEYIQQVWSQPQCTAQSLQVIYDLKNGFDEQTVQDVYKSGNFTIKFVQFQGKPGEGQAGVGSIRVMNPLPEGERHRDGLRDFEDIKTWNLSAFRASIDTM